MAIAASNVHFYVLGGGITVTFGAVLRATWFLGKILERFSGHVKESDQRHKDLTDRVVRLEERRR
jgi:hypothetical protein